MLRIWKDLSLETKIDIILSVGTGIVWGGYILSRVGKLTVNVEEISENITRIADGHLGKTEADLRIWEEQQRRLARAIENDLRQHRLWPGGPTFQ